MIIIPKPFITAPTADGKIEEIRRYLFRLADDLNMALGEEKVTAAQITKQATDTGVGNVLHQLKEKGVEVIYDNRGAGGEALTGVTSSGGLYDGMQIAYWLNYAAGSSATLELTFPDGTTSGAVPCYYGGTSRLGTHYAAGNVLHMTYRENVTIGTTSIAAGWWCDANYYSDSNYDIFGASMKIETNLTAYGLCGITGVTGTIAKQTRTHQAGTYWKVNSFTQTSGTAQTKKAVTKGFYPWKIFYNTGSSALTSADVTGTLSASTSNADLRYTVNGSSSANIGIVGAPFFLVGTIGNDGLFYLNGTEATAEWWQTGVPTTADTYIYWFVGIMSSKYQVRLADNNWFFKFNNGSFERFDPLA